MSRPAPHSVTVLLSTASVLDGLFSNLLGEWRTLATAPSYSLCGFMSALETSLKSSALGTREAGWKGTWLLASLLCVACQTDRDKLAMSP